MPVYLEIFAISDTHVCHIYVRKETRLPYVLYMHAQLCA